MRVASRTMPMRARVVASSRVIRTVWRAVAAPRRAETLSVANNALDIVRVRGCGRSRAGASRVNRHPRPCRKTLPKPYFVRFECDTRGRRTPGAGASAPSRVASSVVPRARRIVFLLPPSRITQVIMAGMDARIDGACRWRCRSKN
jgi:hypothetical protein